MLKAKSLLSIQVFQDQQKPVAKAKSGLSVEAWLRLEEKGLVRRWIVTLSRNESTGRFGLGLNDSNEVTQPPENSGLLQGDFIIGCEGARLGKSRLEDYILLHGEPTIELEVLRALVPHAEMRRQASAPAASSMGMANGDAFGAEPEPRTVTRKWWSKTERKPLLNLSNEHAPEELEGDELAEGMRSMRLLD